MSDWKQGAAKRRDERATKVDAPQRPIAGKKDTKRWCRGKVGVEHKPACFPYSSTRTIPTTSGGVDIFADWRVLACSECGRQFEMWTPTLLTTRPKPAWVVDPTAGGDEGGG